MYQKFNTNNMISKFIKDLLKDTYIPTVPIWNDNDPLVKDMIYVTKEYIVKAKKNYNPSTSNNISVFNNEYFKIICPYIFGQFYQGVTSNFKSSSSMYDSYTHKALGDYLRMIRDLKSINLMQYYNCWNNWHSDKLRIASYKNPDSTAASTIANHPITAVTINANNTIKDGLRCILVPIKFNQKYTIYINSSYPIIVTPIYYTGQTIISPSNIPSFIGNGEIINQCSFNNPYIYNSPVIENLSGTPSLVGNRFLEKYLTLLIQLPDNNDSNIVVLEGDYSENRFINDKYHTNSIKKVFYGINADKLNNLELDNICTSIPGLSRNISNQTYAFSDRLLEYLLLNVIDINDEISENISRIQQYISSYKSLKTNKKQYSQAYIKGVWNNNMRVFIHDMVTTNVDRKSIDINGYVDKDSEELILGGKE